MMDTLAVELTNFKKEIGLEFYYFEKLFLSVALILN